MNAALVIGLGNRWRGDDAVGPLVLDGLRQQSPATVELLESPADSLGLIGAWSDRDTVYLVDACCDGSLADGTVVTINNALEDSSALQRLRHPTSSHVLDLEQAIGMSRAMGNIPKRLAIYGVVGSQFVPGSEPGPAVRAAAADIANRLVAALAPRQSPTD